MTYALAIPQKLSQRVAQPIPQQIPRRACQDQFLIVCDGNPWQGDAAVGSLVAKAVSDWALASVSAVVVNGLTPELAPKLAKADYAIFIEPCGRGDRTQTTHVYPIVLKHPQSHSISVEGQQCSPETLLMLAQRFYGTRPQSWLIKIPTESFGFGQKLSSTALTGMDLALQTVNLFLRNYQQPRF